MSRHTSPSTTQSLPATAATRAAETFTARGPVELFPQPGGWHFVRVPRTITAATQHLADRGLVAIWATVGKTTWPTSLLPYGDGSHFIALSVKVRRAAKIKLGESVTVTFRLRRR